jgi:Ca-activated chloride channel homolog
MSRAIDYYKTLGLPFDATPEEIRGAYFEAARRLHPDANPEPDAEEDFLRIQEAYDVLSNPQKRLSYDAGFPNLTANLPEIKTTIKYSRNALQFLSEPQLLYVLVELECTAQPKTDDYSPVNLCLVIDRSTSMEGARIDMIKQNVFHLIRQLKPQDYLSLVTFGDRADIVMTPTRVADLGPQSSTVSLITTGGGTEIYQGLQAGIDLLKMYPGADMRQVVLMTDGHTYGDEQKCLELAASAAQDGIPICTLGIGNEWNDVFLDKIASLSGGSSLFVTSSQDLTHFLEQKISAMSKIYAKTLTFEFDKHPDVALQFAFRLGPDVGSLPLESPISLGDLPLGKKLTFLLELRFMNNASINEIPQLIKGRINMEIPGKIITNPRILIDISRNVTRSLRNDTPPSEIIEAMTRLNLYRMQEKARQEVARGEIEKATRHLQYLATHLLSQGDRNLAKTVLMEAEAIQKNGHFSQEGEKRIKYGTRALLMLPPPDSI